MSQQNSRTLSYLREFSIVVLGILAALFINKWNENYNNQQFIQTALQTIEKEMNTNQKVLASVYDKHTTLIDSLVYYMHDNSLSVRDVIGKAGGVKYAPVQVIALRFFVGNKAELVPFETISQLLEIETTVNMMEKKFDKLMDFAYEYMEQKDEESKTRFIIHLSNVIDSEETLIELYEMYLQSKNSSPN